MKIKIILIILALGIILFVSLFGSGFKQMAIEKVAAKTQGYICNDNLCTTCIIKGELCECDKIQCECGNNTVPINQCMLGG